MSRSELESILAAFKEDLLAEIRQYLHLQTQDAKIYPYLVDNPPITTNRSGQSFPLHIATVRLINFCHHCQSQGFDKPYQFQSAEELRCGQCRIDRDIMVPNYYFNNPSG